ncbi:MAG: substrate-binding domain-containing protein [Longimicrobiales bacterium]|nr:substrate-binding domain-containing protein [Longimicrobiales bacterium]
MKTETEVQAEAKVQAAARVGGAVTRRWRGTRTGCVVAAVLLGGCVADDRTPLNVRTSLPEDLRDAVEIGFEAAHPDIDVRISQADDETTLSALLDGGGDFDVWWGAPALSLEHALAAGALSEWRPILSTPLVLAFDRTTVALGDAPADWIDVFHHAWYDDVRIPDPARTEAGAWLVGTMIVEGLRDDDDLNRGFDWLERLHDQVDAYMVEPEDIVRALEQGDALIAILLRADVERFRTGDAPWLHYRIPSSGTPEAIRGAGVVSDAVSRDAATHFLRYLESDEVATASKLHTHWDPVVGQVDEQALPRDFELPLDWRAFPPALDTLEAELDGWIARWESEIRVR